MASPRPGPMAHVVPVHVPPIPFTAGAVATPGSRASLEKLFKRYIEDTPLGILLIDADGRITFANPSVSSCFGYSADELLGRPIELLVPTLLREQHVQLRREFLRNPEPRLMANRELKGRRKDGSEVSVAIGLNPMVGDGACRVACTIVDLTERQIAERDLNRFFELSLDLFCIANLRGYFVRVNPNFSRVLGYSSKELLSRPFLDFVHPEDIAATRLALTDLSAGRPLVDFRNRYRDVRGMYTWFEWNARAIAADGAIFAVARDITERVRLERELGVRLRREHAILDNTPAVVYVKDCEGRYEYVNQRHADLLALERMAILGKSERELFPQDVADEFMRNDRRVLESGSKITVQETVPQEDGPHTYVSVKFPLFNAHGEVAAVAGISTDITDELRARETEEQLHLARAFQKKLYPREAPVVAGLDVAASVVPVALLCGDYYDFLPGGPGRLRVAIGDVSGHGIGPSLEMVAVRTMLRMLLREDVDLAHAVRALNRQLCEDLPESAFVTLFLAEIDAPGRRLSYVGAGHEALLISAAGEVLRLANTGLALGIDLEASFVEPASVTIEPGDCFLLFTDGVTEAMNMAGEQFHRRRVADVALRGRQASAEDIIRNLFLDVYEFTAGRLILDDMTMIAVKVRETMSAGLPAG